MSSLKEFLYELSEELRFLPAKQVNEILKHYRDKVNVEVDYGANEEKVISEMKSPQEIAKSIYEMHGIDYLSKRKRISKIKNALNVVIFSLAFVASVVLFIVSSIFIISVLINMLTLIGSVFSFTKVIDIIISFIFTLSYFFVMTGLYIYIIDLFMVLFSILFGKILDSFDKTRGKTFPWMNFTINGWLNKITKKRNLLIKILGGVVLVFALSGITSYVTKGRVYRSINDINTNSETFILENPFESIQIKGNNAYIVLVTDNEITSPQLEYEYEFSNMDYEITNNQLDIKVSRTKTYDFLGILKSPLPLIRIVVPTDFSIDKLNINVEYGKIVLNQLANLTKDVTIKTINAGISLNENKISNEILIESDSSSIVTKANTINSLTIKQASGTLTMAEDNITKFNHQNGSSSVQLVNTYFEEYTLDNQSGSMYLERIKGKRITYTTSTSLNELYDIYFDEGEFIVKNTGSLKITRSLFNTEVSVESISSSHQTISYMSSPQINLKGRSGQILCEYINHTYTRDKINKFDADYQPYIEEYNEKIQNANFDIILDINSSSANVSLSEIKAKELKFEIAKASTAMLNLDIETSKISATNTGVKINNFYGSTMNLKLLSTEYNAHTSVEYYNDEKSDIVVNLIKDGMSEIMWSDHIKVEYGE